MPREEIIPETGEHGNEATETVFSKKEDETS
jgi:hypothetical protein